MKRYNIELAFSDGLVKCYERAYEDEKGRWVEATVAQNLYNALKKMKSNDPEVKKALEDAEKE